MFSFDMCVITFRKCAITIYVSNSDWLHTFSLNVWLTGQNGKKKAVAVI